MEGKRRSIVHYLRVFGAYANLHLKTAMEYRANFIAQSTFMVLNDIMFMLVFYFLFRHFGTINGYSARYAMLVFGITGFAFGIMAVLFGNLRNLSTIVTEGQLDIFLSAPVDELFHALIAKSSFSGFGDIIFGILIIAAFFPNALLIGIVAGTLGGVILLSFGIIIECLGFIMERPKNATRAAQNATIAFTGWPIDAYSSTVRMVLYAIPFAFVGAVPEHLIEQFTWAELGALSAVAVAILVVSVLLWKMGLRRYESGNMMTVRT